MFSEPALGGGEERYVERDYGSYTHMEKQRNYHNHDTEDREVGKCRVLGGGEEGGGIDSNLI